MGNNPAPFSVLAADVNTDLVINVLDIVGTVNIILHPVAYFFAKKENVDMNGSAYLSLQNNNLKLINTIPVAGIQFRLSGSNAQSVTFTPSSELIHFQVASGSKSDTSKTFIIFSMSDTTLNSGIHTLGTFTGLHSGIIIKDTLIADKDGNGIITGTEGNENPGIPQDYFLGQNYPNPFNPVTKIKFEIPSNGFPIGTLGNDRVVLKIYDIVGREIQTLVNEKLNPGRYEVTFDGSNLSSGIYFYKLVAGDFSDVKKMVLVK